MAVLSCAGCGQENPPEARFCLSCGAAVAFACAGCASTLPPGARFCVACGQPVAGRAPASYTPRHLQEQILAVRSAIEGERKQVTVVFCDVVRSSALAAELGPEEMHRTIDAFFAVALDAVHRYDGTINQFLGDGFMALFGAPIAHEDHARRALLAALAIRDGADVELRIGVNSGLVVVGTIGDDLRMDYTASGDSTILAARLEAAAPPGEIFVSEATAAKVRGYFALEPSPPVDVKGRTVRPLRLTGLGARTSPIDARAGLSPFSGRDRELQALRELLTTAMDGQGQLVGISGEAGLGKSRLVYEFCQLAHDSATVLEGRCLSYGSRIAYVPILDVLRQACGVQLADAPDDVAGKVGLTLAALELDREHARYLLHALGVVAGDELGDLDPPMILRRTFDAVRDLVLAEAQRRPLVLVIEDLHWIDNTSQELLLELADEVASARILLLSTYRPAYTPPWLASSGATQIALRPLARAASEQVVQWALGDARRDVTSIVARGEGNPFFLEELASAERDEVGDADAGVVPGTVQDVLAARIDRLEPAQKTAIQLAAVLGRELPLTLAEAIWDADEPLLARLRELKRLEFLREQRGPDGPSFVFKHALTREVAYDGLLEARRKELHGRAGDALEHALEDRVHEQCELLAYHYAHSPDRERAAEYLMLANRKAASRHAMEEAIGYFYDALAVLEALPDSEANRRSRVALVLEQLPEFHWTHRNQEFHELLLRHQPLVDGFDDAALTGSFYALLSHRYLIFGQYEAALETATRALGPCDASGTAAAAAMACLVHEWAHMMRGDYARAVQAHAEGRKRLAAGYDAAAYMYTQTGVAIAYLMSGRWNDALAELDEAVETGLANSDNGLVSFSKTFAGWVHLERRDWKRALEVTSAAVELAPTVYFRNFAYAMHAAALCHTGSMEQGLPLLEQIAPAIRATRHEMGWIVVAWRLALGEMEAGRAEQARELLREMHESATRSHARFFLGGAERCLAELAIDAGDATGALELLRPAIETLRATGSENELARALAACGRSRRMLGDLEAAHTDLRDALAIFERLGTLQEPDRLRRELAVPAGVSAPTAGRRGLRGPG